jgi:prevent-host-death family protein
MRVNFMNPVNMLEAKSSLSRLVQSVEDGREREIVIARNGKPVARLVPMESAPANRRIGVAKGRFEIGASIDQHNEEIASQFLGGSSP